MVAEEIRKLAEQVLYSSKNIHTLVETVTTNTNEVSYNTEKYLKNTSTGKFHRRYYRFF